MANGPATGWINTGRSTSQALYGGATVTPRDWYPAGFFGKSAPGATQLRLAGSSGMTGLAGVTEAGVGRGFSSADTIRSGTASNPATIRALAANFQRIKALESAMNAAYDAGDQALGDSYAYDIESMGLNPEDPFDAGYKWGPVSLTRGGPENEFPPPSRSPFGV
jgi:hypothetical protein